MGGADSGFPGGGEELTGRAREALPATGTDVNAFECEVSPKNESRALAEIAPGQLRAVEHR